MMRKSTRTSKRPGDIRRGVVVPVVAALALAACTPDPPVSDANFDTTICAPENGPFSTVIDNPYLPLLVGSVRVIEGIEAGEHAARSQHTILDETLVIDGVTVVVDEGYAWDGPDLDHLELVGVEREYFAQAPDGTVCNFGADEDIYENGEIVEHDSWRPGEDGAVPGVRMPGTPEVGMIFEMARDEEAVETGEITYVGVPFETPAGTFEDTITVLEDGPSLKRYARGVGMIYDDGLVLVSYEE